MASIAETITGLQGQDNNPHRGLSIRTQEGLIKLDRETAPAVPGQKDFPMGGRTINPRATIPHPGGTGELLTPEQAEQLKRMLKARQRPAG